jgi:hypothetical protein
MAAEYRLKKWMVAMAKIRFVVATCSWMKLGMFGNVFRCETVHHMVVDLITLMWCDQWLLGGSFVMDLVVVLTSHLHDDWWIYDIPIRMRWVAFYWTKWVVKLSNWTTLYDAIMGRFWQSI